MRVGPPLANGDPALPLRRRGVGAHGGRLVEGLCDRCGQHRREALDNLLPMFFLALAPRAEERGVKVAAHVHLERVHAVDVGVLVPADGGVDLLARPRKACILLSEQLPRPREPLGLKGLHAERPWWPAHADDARDAEPLRVKVDYLEHDDRDSMPTDALAVSDEEARHSHLCVRAASFMCLQPLPHSSQPCY